MKYALYFVGSCFLVWAAVIAWAVNVFVGTIADAKFIIDKAPVVIEKTQDTIESVKQAAVQISDQTEKLKATLPSLERIKEATPSPEIMRTYAPTMGEIGAHVLKGFAGKIAAEPEVEASKP